MKICVADVETTMLKDGEFPRTLFWRIAIEGEETRRFDTTAELWTFLASRTDSLKIFHHADYEIKQILIDGLEIRPSLVVNGNVVESWSHGARHVWRNSYNLFPTKLADILESCGFAKPGLDTLEERNEADTTDALKALFIIADKYEAMAGVNPLTCKGRTSASVAFHAAEGVAGPLNVDLATRVAYTGGRTEAFRVGDAGMAVAYDINSSYPASFLEAQESEELLRVRVDVETEYASPFWLRHMGAAGYEKLIFPRGRFETWVYRSSLERYIIDSPSVLSVRVLEKHPVDASWLVRVSPFVSHAYELRAKAKACGDKAMAYSTKIFLNALYGKLGTKDTRETLVMKRKPPTPGADGRVKVYRLPGDLWAGFVSVKAQPKANYKLAAFITCNARARLFAALERAGNALYCDTDSVYMPENGTPPENIGSGLGQWKEEARGNMVLRGAKDYAFNGKEVLKGGREYFRHTLKSTLGGTPVRTVVRTRKAVYDKREVFPDGRTIPLLVGR